MTDHPSRTVLERLRAIDWSDDSKAFEHANSRALLMREYLRRAALWARAYGAERSWPFFDIAEYVDAAVQTPPEVATTLAEVLERARPRLPQDHVPRCGPVGGAQGCSDRVAW